LPIELVSFSGVSHENSVLLTWVTASESGNAGFEVQHAVVEGSRISPFSKRGWVEGGGYSLNARTYSYRVEDVGPGYHLFRLKQVDLDGSFSLSPTIDVVLDGSSARPALRVYPNPAQDLVMVEFGMIRGVPVRVALYDVLGRELVVLYEGAAGSDRMMRSPLFVGHLPAGLYFVRVEAGSSFVVGRPLVVGSVR
jgi:hypothetical protein